MRAVAGPFLTSVSARPLSMLLLLMCTDADDLTFHDVPADGNCLFASLALSAALMDEVQADQMANAVASSAKRLRLEAMDLLCPTGEPDQDLIMSGLPASLIIEPMPGEDGAGYCQRMRQDGQWGSTAEILALTHILRREIRVHTSFGTERYGAEESERSGLHPLAIHFWNQHYRAVTSRKDTLLGKDEL